MQPAVWLKTPRGRDTEIAMRPIVLLSLLALPLCAVFAAGPEYTADGRLKFPADYREWVYLSTGIGMTYGPLAAAGQYGPPVFDNIFVNPEAYHAFLKTGRWPDKAIIVMEGRHSESHASINNGGHFQTDLTGLEARVLTRTTMSSWNVPKPRVQTIWCRET